MVAQSHKLTREDRREREREKRRNSIHKRKTKNTNNNNNVVPPKSNVIIGRNNLRTQSDRMSPIKKNLTRKNVRRRRPPHSKSRLSSSSCGRRHRRHRRRRRGRLRRLKVYAKITNAHVWSPHSWLLSYSF